MGYHTCPCVLSNIENFLELNVNNLKLVQAMRYERLYVKPSAEALFWVLRHSIWYKVKCNVWFVYLFMCAAGQWRVDDAFKGDRPPSVVLASASKFRFPWQHNLRYPQACPCSSSSLLKVWDVLSFPSSWATSFSLSLMFSFWLLD